MILLFFTAVTVKLEQKRKTIYIFEQNLFSTATLITYLCYRKNGTKWFFPVWSPQVTIPSIRNRGSLHVQSGVKSPTVNA